MEFNEKLQELRKSKGMTQEELAQALYVSRTAVSKWESGRGYPSIDSLREISRFFGVTIDELICSEEMISVAEDEKRTYAERYLSFVCGALDFLTAIILRRCVFFAAELFFTHADCFHPSMICSASFRSASSCSAVNMFSSSISVAGRSTSQSPA